MPRSSIATIRPRLRTIDEIQEIKQMDRHEFMFFLELPSVNVIGRKNHKV